MKRVEVKDVKSAFEGLVSEGRGKPVQLSVHTTPAQALERMSDDDFSKLDVLGMYKGISANSYSVKASALWTALFWKIGEQILECGTFDSPFAKYFKELTVGGDVEEVAPRLKEGLDRDTLSNSALLTNYTTKYDSFYHRINKFKVFASTYDQYEIQRLSNSWENMTNMLNVELENIVKSANTYMHDLAKNAISSQYFAGGMDAVVLPPYTTTAGAQEAAIRINDVIDAMTLEPTEKFIPFNKNSNNSNPHIRDVAVSDILLVAEAPLLNNVEFLTTLNTYFGERFANARFSFNAVKVSELPQSVSADIAITPGYSPVSGKKLRAVLLEEDALLFRQKQIGTYNFDNAATLKTSIFRHIDAFADISDRRKCCAFVE